MFTNLRNLIKTVLIAICCYCFSPLQLFASENNQSTYSAWVDKSSSASINTITEQTEWQPFTGWKTWGFGPEPIWIRIELPASPNSNEKSKVLVVHPPFLDYVTFYDPIFGTVSKAGDYLPEKNDALSSVLFTFEVPQHSVAREVFLRIESTSTRVVRLSLMPLKEAESYTRVVEWSTGALLVFSFVFWCWAVLQWWFSRDRLMAIFLIKQTLVTLWGFYLLGFSRITIGEFFEEGNLSLISNVVIGTTVASAIWFLSELLKLYNVRQWMLKIVQASIIFISGMTLLNFVDQTRLALEIINTLAPAVLVWILISLIAAPQTTEKLPISKTGLLCYLILYTALNSLPALTYIGFLEGSAILFIGNTGLLVLDGFIILVILNMRQRQLADENRAYNTELAIEKEQSLLNTQYLKEQRELLAMLAHEIKTPLANIRVWMDLGPKGQSVIKQSIEDMNRIIERCLQVGQISDNSLQPRNDWLNVGELTQSVISSSPNASRVNLEIRTGSTSALIDGQMLSIILSNLLENAYKYSPTDSAINIQITSKNNLDGLSGFEWTISNRVGEADFPDANKVFEKYYRSPQAQRQSGSGLGLYIVKSLLTLMQGSISYSSSASIAIFSFWIPVRT